MNQMIRAIISGLLASFGLLAPQSAEAATQANYDVSYCDGGTYEGTGKNELQNGLLKFGWCSSGGGATTITLRYAKTSGSDITAQFGYEWVNSNGSRSAGRHWDQSNNNVVTIEAGETWGARFRRDPAEQPPTDLTPCLRGLIKVNSTTIYSTEIVCR